MWPTTWPMLQPASPPEARGRHAAAAGGSAATSRSVRRWSLSKKRRYAAMSVIMPLGSGAGRGVDVAHALGELVLAPGAAAIEGAEDLSVPRDAVHLVGAPRIQGHRHHGAVRLDAVVEARPGLSDVAAHVEGAVLAPGGRTEAGVEHPRILRRYPDVAAVREGGEAPHLHVLPVRAAVLAEEEAHAQSDEHRARPRRTDAQGVAVQHALDVRVAHDPALEMRQLSELEEVSAAVFPGLPAVKAPHDAAYLQRGVDLVRPRRVDVHPHHTAGEGHLHPLGQHGLLELPPRLPRVVAPVDAHRRGAHVEHPRPRRMHKG